MSRRLSSKLCNCKCSVHFLYRDYRHQQYCLIITIITVIIIISLLLLQSSNSQKAVYCKCHRRSGTSHGSNSAATTANQPCCPGRITRVAWRHSSPHHGHPSRMDCSRPTEAVLKILATGRRTTSPQSIRMFVMSGRTYICKAQSEIATYSTVTFGGSSFNFCSAWPHQARVNTISLFSVVFWVVWHGTEFQLRSKDFVVQGCQTCGLRTAAKQKCAARHKSIELPKFTTECIKNERLLTEKEYSKIDGKLC